jgi:histidyl-tRNA synthetase
MANKSKFQAIKGTRDLLPPETELWNRVEQTAREVFGTFGFGEIRLPIFEPTELFARAVGGETDIVSKEMYTFEDHDLPELEQGRSALILWSFSVEDLLEFSSFTRNVQNYLDKVTKAITEGELSKSPENKHALLQMRTYLDQMERSAKRYAETQSSSDEEAFDEYHEGIKSALLAIHYGDVLSLRPEATASVCRAYIEHNMQQLPQPVKLYYTGPMFRRERPQKGRYRQFYQIGAEVLGGTDAPGIDAEVIEMVMVFFARLGLEGIQLDINSIGHSAPDCRRGYVEKLKAALLAVKDNLGEDSQRRIETNPLRVLDSKLKHEQAIIATLPKIGDHLCADCASHYAEVKRQLELRGVRYKENWRLVRGLDYYMRTTFEITAQGLGSQNAVCGGGRYDGLVELLGGPPTKGIGFAIGEDRLILSLLETRHSSLATRHSLDVYLAWMGEKAQATAISAARTLRSAGFRVELPPVEQKFGKALGQADKLGARYALILGEDEVASGQWTLKTLADGSQAKYTEAELLEFLKTACSPPLQG